MVVNLEASPREAARQKACKLMGGGSCPCEWSQCQFLGNQLAEALRRVEAESEASAKQHERESVVACSATSKLVGRG